MRKTRKVVYNVQCSYNVDHVFEKAFDVEKGSEDKQTQIETFCPFCEKIVKITVQGKVALNTELLREFNISLDDV